MAPSTHKDRIRDSWQPRQLGGAPAWAWLIVRRLVATLIAVGLISVFGWLLIRRLSSTDTHLAYWTATTYAPSSGQPLAYAYQDFKAINPLVPAINNAPEPKSDGPPKDPLTSLTKESIENRLDLLSGGVLDDKETLILCITAHGVVNDKKANLLCEPGGANDLYLVSTLLEKIGKLPTKTKLLVLDTGRDNYNPPFDSATNSFTALLEQEVKALNDPHLWVLTANGPLERSHTSPSLRRSVFGYVLSTGLSKAADEDHDGYIQLDELYQCVQNGVTQWVKKATSENETQTPLLLHADPTALEPQQLADCDLLSTKSLPSGTTEDSEPDKNSVMRTLGDLATEQAEELKPEALVEATAGEIHPDAANKGGGGGPAAGQESSAGNRGIDGKIEAGNDHALRAQLRLDNALRQLSQIEEFPPDRHPSTSAPWQWRNDVRKVLWCEQFSSVGIPENNAKKWSEVIVELDSINQILSSYIANGVPAVPDGLTADHPLNEYPSLAMAEQIANHHPNSDETKEIRVFAESYDKWLADANASSIATLDAILPENKDATKSTVPIESRKKFYELQLLVELRRPEAEVPWELVRSVLKTRRAGEKAASNLLCGAGWAQDKIIAADQARLEAERLILDRTNSNWGELAKERLADAVSLYEEANQAFTTVLEIQQHRNLLLRRAPDYVRWAQLSAADKDARRENTIAIKSLFASLRSVNQSLAAPSTKSYQALKQFDDQLQNAHKVLEALLKPTDERPDPSDDEAWRIGNLLDTALPDAIKRPQLRDERKKAETKLMKPFNPSPAPVASQPQGITGQQREEMKEQLELELELFRLGGRDLEVDLDKLKEAHEKLSTLNAELPESIASLVKLADLRNVVDRPARLAQLRGAMCGWLLLDDKLDAKDNLTTALNRANWYDLLSWQIDRFQRGNRCTAARRGVLAERSRSISTACQFDSRTTRDCCFRTASIDARCAL